MQYIAIIAFILELVALILTRKYNKKKDELIKNHKKEIKKYKRENADLRFENEEYRDTKRHIKDLISNYETNNTNIYTLIRDIKNELDNPLKLI